MKALRKLIKDSELKHYEIAEGICDTGTLSNMLNEKRKMSHETYVKIMNKLGLNHNDFAGATTEEDANAILRRNELKHLLRQSDADSLDEAKKIIEEIANAPYFSQDEGSQMLLGHRAALAGFAGEWEQMKKYAIQGLEVTRTRGGKCFDEDKIDIYVLSIEEVKLVNQLAVAYANMQQYSNALSKKSSLQKSIEILVKLNTSLENKFYHDEELANIHIAMLYNLATLLGKEKRFDDEIIYCDIGIKLCKRYRNGYIEPMFMLNKAWSLLCVGNEKDGKDLLQKACAIFKATDRHDELDTIQESVMKEFGITVVS